MRVLAAGSLKPVWPLLMTQFTGTVRTDYAPAGLLRERIEAGEACDLFASASEVHATTLLNSGHALAVMPFATNRLCLTVRSDLMLPGDDWYSLLTRQSLRLATSTPVADPSGDYAQILFTRMGDVGDAVRHRAQALVGGPDTVPIPAGRLAADWIIQQDQADLFIGYASYRAALSQIDGLSVIDIPATFNPIAHYTCAVISPEARKLAEFLVSEQAKVVLQQAGFGV